jgi:hypothetical protein
LKIPCPERFSFPHWTKPLDWSTHRHRRLQATAAASISSVDPPRRASPSSFASPHRGEEPHSPFYSAHSMPSTPLRARRSWPSATGRGGPHTSPEPPPCSPGWVRHFPSFAQSPAASQTVAPSSRTHLRRGLRLAAVAPSAGTAARSCLPPPIACVRPGPSDGHGRPRSKGGETLRSVHGGPMDRVHGRRYTACVSSASCLRQRQPIAAHHVAPPQPLRRPPRRFCKKDLQFPEFTTMPFHL